MKITIRDLSKLFDEKTVNRIAKEVQETVLLESKATLGKFCLASCKSSGEWGRLERLLQKVNKGENVKQGLLMTSIFRKLWRASFSFYNFSPCFTRSYFHKYNCIYLLSPWFLMPA